MTGGPASGVVAGFGAGLALDLAPPASQLVGQYALVLCLIGYGSGRLRFVLRHSAVLTVAAAAAMAALGEALSAVLTLALDTPEVTRATVAQVLPPTVLYDVALAPVILLCSVRLAVALGMSFDPHDDSPALETGGSAAPAIAAGVTGAPGIAGMDAAAQLQRTRHAPNRARRQSRRGERQMARRRRRLRHPGDGFHRMACRSRHIPPGPPRAGTTDRHDHRGDPAQGCVLGRQAAAGPAPLTPWCRRRPTDSARLRPGAGAAGSAAARPGPSYHARSRGRPVTARPGRRTAAASDGPRAAAPAPGATSPSAQTGTAWTATG